MHFLGICVTALLISIQPPGKKTVSSQCVGGMLATDDFGDFLSDFYLLRLLDAGLQASAQLSDLVDAQRV